MAESIGEGLYLGAEKLTGKALTQLSELAEAISGVTKRFKGQQKKRKKVTRWGKFLKTAIPGFGHAVDFLLDRYAQDRYNLVREKDKEKIREKEGFYTGREGTKMIDALQEQENLQNVDWGEALLSELADYGTSWAGQEMISRTGVGSFMDKYKQKLPSWASWGIPDVADPTKVEITDVPAVQLSRESETAGDFLPWKQLLKEEGGIIPKYYGGGNVRGEDIPPTITDYFSKQGKTLGGSDKQSLAERLGRK